MSDKPGLSHNAYEPLPKGESYSPYVPASENLLEFTIKAAVPGIMFGILFGAANAYIGLQTGLTISTSIPVAVMTVAFFRAMRSLGIRGTILEANQSQTIGSASSSVASGVIFTLPALFMWGFKPELLQMTLLALCGGFLGVLFMIPLRRFLIEREHGHLPYPEGTACAEVLVASEVGGAKAINVFLGLGMGALVKFIVDWLRVIPKSLKLDFPFVSHMQVGTKVSAALLGVGYILGPRIASIMVGGGLLSSLIIIPIIAWWGADRTEPFFPETVQIIADMSVSGIWNRYVRYIGAGAVATAGLITLIKSIPTMIESFRIGAQQLKARLAGRSEVVKRTAHDLPLSFVGLGVTGIALALALVPQIFGISNFGVRACAAICVLIFAFFFVTVASRIVGLVGVTSNPTSGMTIATLIGTSIAFWLLGWRDDTGKVTALTVGCVVAIAASIAGDTSQDLKTGFLLGATPRRQQIGELIGVLTCSVFVCMTLLLLDQPGRGFGSEELPAPQATLMMLVIEGVLEMKLPWVLVGIGAAIAITAELLRLPSLPFAVGVYLPVSTMVPVFIGGMLRLLIERTAGSKATRESRRENGVLFGSGLVGGEGLMGVGVAAAAYYQINRTGSVERLPFEIGHEWAATWPSVLAVVVMGALIGMMIMRSRKTD
ncbi:MAG: oligopeptide transporter, OPT family [Planctomycetota bacterium]|nr:oligopeptide transporter, OPT family [Planctomycetota bacterium]